VSDPAEAGSQAARGRDRSTKGRRAARHEKFDRERRIVNYLNAGVSVAEIAEREGVTHRRMRAVVQEILARRAPAPPAEFLALQVCRVCKKYRPMSISIAAIASGGGAERRTSDTHSLGLRPYTWVLGSGGSRPKPVVSSRRDMGAKSWTLTASGPIRTVRSSISPLAVKGALRPPQKMLS
jgi:hypothetical protein